MKQPINRFAATTLTAAVLSMSLASAAIAAESTMLAANNTVDKAEQAVSDTWITSKVKSTFIADKSLSALDIKVETNQGVVSLSGVVANDAERDLAIAKTQEVEGVRDVAAEALKTAD